MLRRFEGLAWKLALTVSLSNLPSLFQSVLLIYTERITLRALTSKFGESESSLSWGFMLIWYSPSVEWTRRRTSPRCRTDGCSCHTAMSPQKSRSKQMKPYYRF